MSISSLSFAKRDKLKALFRGFRHRCPSCGNGAMFNSYLKVRTRCATCNEDLSHHRADDAPPYFTMFAVGHIVVPLALVIERIWHPNLWLHTAIWLPLTLGLTLILLPSIKGAVVGMQWALRMHGFELADSGIGDTFERVRGPVKN